jgi:hypothetical protein
LVLYLLFSYIAVSSFFWFFIFCSVVLPFLFSFDSLSSVQLYCRFFFLLVLYLLFSCIAVSSFFWSFIFCLVVWPFLLSFGSLSSV